MKNKILCIIPARSGSKGIPSKNIQKVCNKPLIDYTIKIAKKSSLINRIIVSTDSKKIADVARRSGAEIPFIRPKKISRDSSTITNVVQHALKFLLENESYVPDIITILQPTSPIRTEAMIDKSINLLKKNNSSSVITVSKIKIHPDILFFQKNNYLKPMKKSFERHSIRQSRSKLYCPTGSIYTFWHKTLRNYNSIYGPRIRSLIIKKEEFNIDIDEPFDLFMFQMTKLYWNQFKRKFNL